jgi:hypothetical protein
VFFQKCVVDVLLCVFAEGEKKKKRRTKKKDEEEKKSDSESGSGGGGGGGGGGEVEQKKEEAASPQPVSDSRCEIATNSNVKTSALRSSSVHLSYSLLSAQQGAEDLKCTLPGVPWRGGDRRLFSER